MRDPFSPLWGEQRSGKSERPNEGPTRLAPSSWEGWRVRAVDPYPHAVFRTRGGRYHVAVAIKKTYDGGDPGRLTRAACAWRTVNTGFNPVLESIHLGEKDAKKGPLSPEGSAVEREPEELAHQLADPVGATSEEPRFSWVIKRVAMASLGVAFVSVHAIRGEVASRRLASVRLRGLRIRRLFHAIHGQARTLPAGGRVFVAILPEQVEPLHRGGPGPLHEV
jgi:hypothetical protein